MGIFSSLADSFSTPNPSQDPKHALSDLQLAVARTGGGGAYQLQLDSLYSVTPSNWYTAKPYGFKLTKRDGKTYVMFLPISPSNINVTTHFATNMIPTLYGTVEEHSDVRYYDIVIEGTTGIAPQFTNVSSSLEKGNGIDTAYDDLRQPGRAKFNISSNVALGGFFSNTVSQVSNLLNQAGKAVSAISSPGEPGAPGPETAVYTDQTGYVAFHNLYRFLLPYKKDAAGLAVDPADQSQYKQKPYNKAHPLTFFNYKDGNEYNVVMRNFVLRKSADHPMLYNYSIVMRGYNIKTGGQNLNLLDSMAQRLRDLGLNGVQSSTYLSQVKAVTNGAKAVVGGALNAKNLFGR